MRVVVVTGADPGHVFPAAALAAALRRRNHEPTVLAAQRWLPALAADGISARALPPGPPEQPGRSADFGYRLHGRAAELAPAVAAAIRQLDPDLVVADVLSAAGSFAAELLAVPHVELVPHLLHLPSSALPPPGSGLRPGHTAVGRGRDALLRRLAARSRAGGDEQRAAARKTLGLPVTAPEPARRLIATLPLLEPQRPDWPADTDIVGPLFWDPVHVELHPPPGAGPVVLLVASTAASGRPGLLAAALDGLSEVRLAVPMLADHPGTVPSWAAVGPGRLAPLVQRAELVISGAGHGMVSRALAAGRPLVLVPGGGDQRELANRVAQLGAGVVLRRLTPDRLAVAVRHILAEPSFAAAARRLAATQAQIDPVDACERAANWAA